MAGKRVLVLGSGGREHALAWKLASSPEVARVIVAPGNAGMPAQWERWPTELSQGRPEFERLGKRALELGVDLVVVGPDDPLAAGVVDVMEAQGLLVFGPSQAAAQLEASKAFAKTVMQAAGVPTARFEIVSTEDELEKALSKDFAGFVVKADGLALGKGVVVARDRAHAREAAREFFKKHRSLVIEERVPGTEISWLALCDGEGAAMFEPARDFKRARDGDQGPNTGGMGAVSPVEGVHPKLAARVRREVFEPVLSEMRKRGTPFKGVLYAGLMGEFSREDSRYVVLEFNARFGDPETQVLLPRLEEDLYPWLEGAAQGALPGRRGSELGAASRACVVVVGAARGYPDAPEKGGGLSVPQAWRAESPDPAAFFAGVASSGAELVQSGGRVLGVLGQGGTVAQARAQAYARLKDARGAGLWHRRDIAAPGLVVMASGRGSNFEALLAARARGELCCEIRALVSDQPGARALELAREAGIACEVVPWPKDRVLHARLLNEAVGRYAPEWVVLAGFMRVLAPDFLARFRDSNGMSRVVNIHPSLLPAFKGLDGYRQAWEAGASRTGVTVHLVDAELDAGPICAQESFSLAGLKSLEEVEKAGLQVEHRLYAQTLQWLLTGQWMKVPDGAGGSRVERH